jgi:hypothetical protein
MHAMAQSPSPARSARHAALAHPVFWCALATLLINDHLLKGAGILPGAVTGKLSDVAGMIVAPVLGCALLGARSARARAGVFAAVALAFSLFEVSPAAARGWDAMLGALGIPSRSWADPGDLIALAVLPIAWWIAGRSSTGARAASGPSLAIRRSAVALGLFACIATTRAPDATWTTGNWLHNRTGQAVDVRLRWVEGALGCDALSAPDANLSAAASPLAFGDGLTFRLAPGDTIPLEGEAARVAASGGFPGAPAVECELVSISVDGLPASVVWFPSVSAQAVALRSEAPILGSLELIADERDPAARILRGASSHRIAALVETPPMTDPACSGARGETVSFSDPGEALGAAWTLEYRGLLPDGCTELDLVDDDRDASRVLFVCAPEDFVPFAVGDRLEIVETDDPTLLHLRSEDRGEELFLVSGASSIDTPYRREVISLGEPDLGCIERMACGAAVAPAAVVGAELDVAVDRTTTTGPRVRLLVTRAEQVVIARDGCDAGRDRAGALLDAVIVVTERASAR